MHDLNPKNTWKTLEQMWRCEVRKYSDIEELLREDASGGCAVLSPRKERELRLPRWPHGVARHLQGGGGALELQLNNVASQGRAGISPGASRQSLRTLGSRPGALSSLSCQDHGSLCVTWKAVDGCFVLFFLLLLLFFLCNKINIPRSDLSTRCKRLDQTSHTSRLR